MIPAIVLALVAAASSCTPAPCHALDRACNALDVSHVPRRRQMAVKLAAGPCVAAAACWRSWARRRPEPRTLMDLLMPRRT